jgi:hypothetical protein
METAETDRTQASSSVEAAIAALSQLEGSLRQGGFAEGATAYQRMAEVLVAQRFRHEAALAEHPRGDPGEPGDGLTDRYTELGSLARRIFELLEPYAGAMRRLASMAPEPIDERATDALLDHLARRGRRGATASVLVRATRLPAGTVARALAALAADGRVVSRRTGDVETFRVTELVTRPAR